MKNLFIPYELAVTAKELGFSDDCFAYYGDEILFTGIGVITNRFVKSHPKKHPTYLAPLYQQIVDWLREEHKLQINIVCGEINANPILYSYEVYNNSTILDSLTHFTYYEALNKAITEAFKLIK